MAMLLVTAASGAVMFASSAATATEEKPGQEVCGPLDSGKINTSGEPQTVTVTAPEGSLITEYCVKAGSDVSVEEGAVRYFSAANGDFDPAPSVTFPHPSGKAISHYSYSYAPACEFDATILGSDPSCRDDKPDPMVTSTEWVDGVFGCDDKTVERTRTVTTTPYKFDEQQEEWVLDVSQATSKTDKETRNLTDAEMTTCAVEVTPTNPPADNEVASQSPVVPAQAPTTQAPAATAATAAPTALPSTGSSSWATALMALVALLGGTGLVRLSRRPTD